MNAAHAAVAVFLLSFATHSIAQVRCFEMDQPNLPEASAPQSVLGKTETRRWCYWNDRRFSFIFNADSETFHPELAALVEWTANHRIAEITHGSLLRGQVSFHRSHVPVNPLPVPLDVEKIARAGMREVEMGPILWMGAKAALTAFQRTRTAAYDYQIQEGTFEQTLEASKLPYAGYWWPYDGVALAAGPHSPLGKYDAIVARWTGTDPQSAAWELENHSSTEVSWGGHCNGWAASSVLYPDFTKFLWDKDSQQVLLPSDIKGILTESSFCVDYAFYGRRFNGKAGDEMADIHPDLFHQVLVYYLDEVKKPVAFDYERDIPVDNNVISGYKMTIKKVEGRNQFHVVAELRTHHYQGERVEGGGPAAVRHRVYEYTLDVDENNQIVKGTWISENPDFLWVPLAPKKQCGSRKPQVDPDLAAKIASAFPQAKQNKVTLGFSLGRRLAPHEEIEIPLPALKGTAFTIQLKAAHFTERDNVLLVAKGTAAHPTTKWEGRVLYWYSFGGERGETLYYPLTDIVSLKIVNDSNKASEGDTLSLGDITYWGSPEANSGREGFM